MADGEQQEAAVLRDPSGSLYIVPRAELERWRVHDTAGSGGADAEVRGYAFDTYMQFLNYTPNSQVFNFSFQPLPPPPPPPSHR